MYDLAVIGLGPAGCAAVDIALKNNLKIVVFEQNEPGGTCLNVGCIPTKSILHCANFYSEIKNSSKLGINTGEDISFDWEKILNRKTNIVSKFNKVLNSNYSKNTTLIKAKAKLLADGDNIKISADDNIYEAKNIIIATGSKPREIAGLEFDSKFILSSDDLYNLKELPKRVAIVGSGAIGLEWAMILSQLGVEVSVIEKAVNLAPLFDIDIQKRIERILKQNKIKFFKDDYIVNIENNKILLNSKVEFEVDCILGAVGRVPVLPEISSLDKTEKELIVSKDFTTNYKNLYVIGDALNDIMLAHNATYQAKAVMNSILFNEKMPDKIVPSVVYITPEIASVGIREQDILNDDSYKIKKIMVTSIAKSWCDEAADGIVKVIIKDNKIKGAHVVSKEATSLISLFNVFIDLDIDIEKIENMIFPHPSFQEAVAEVLKID